METAIMQLKKINRERLELLHSTNAIQFGKPENSSQIEALEYLEMLKPDERIEVLTDMYELYKAAMQQNMSDYHKMIGR